MSKPDDIKFKVGIEADQAIDGLKQVAQGTKNLNEDVADSGKTASGVSGDLRKLSNATQDLREANAKASRSVNDVSDSLGEQSSTASRAGASIADMATQWAGAIALGPAIFSMLDGINERLKEGARLSAEMGKNMQGLSANIGGNEAHKLTDDLINIAADSGFDKQGMMQLADFMESATNLRPNMNAHQRKALAEQGALLQRATGKGGDQAFQLINTVAQNYNMTDAQATDFVTGLLGGGMNESTIADFASKGADPKFIAAAYAARERLPLNVGGGQINSLIAAMRKTDTEGYLAPELEDIGITEEMPPWQRVERAFAARSAGEINEGQFYKLMGGQSTEAFVRAIAPEMTRAGAVDEALAALLDPDLAESAVARKLANPDYRRHERMNRAQLRTDVAKYKQAMSNVGEGQMQAEAELEAEGVPKWMQKLGTPWIWGHSFLNSSDEAVNNLDGANLDEIYKMTGRYQEIQDRVQQRISDPNNINLNDLPPAPNGGSLRGRGALDVMLRGAAPSINYIITNLNGCNIDTRSPLADMSPNQVKFRE